MLLLIQSSGTLWLRLLSVYGGILREEIRTRASFNTTLTNYVSEESLRNEIYDKNNNNKRFYFRKVQEPVRREMTKWLHSLIYKASIIVRVPGSLDILIGCLDIHI